MHSFARTPLAIAAACNNIHIINSVIDLGDEDSHIYVSGSHSSPLIDRNGRTQEYYTPRRDERKEVNEIRIHIVHGFLTDKDWPEGVPYTKINKEMPIKIEFINAPLDAAYARGELIQKAIDDGLLRETETNQTVIDKAVRTYYTHNCPSWTSTMSAGD